MYLDYQAPLLSFHCNTAGRRTTNHQGIGNGGASSGEEENMKWEEELKN